MFVIVGLGNPSREYKGTRHNAGFEVIDRISEKYNISVNIKKHRALIGKGMIQGKKVILAKPQTFMNLSGESVRSLVNFYQLDVTRELVVVYDDVFAYSHHATDPACGKLLNAFDLVRIHKFGGLDENGVLQNSLWRGVINHFTFRPLE